MKLNKIIRIGIVGTGGMAQSHATKLSKIPNVKLAACADIFPERSQAFAQKWNIPGVYTDYKKMLDMEKLNGISVVTSDNMHAPVSLYALKKKVAVLFPN